MPEKITNALWDQFQQGNPEAFSEIYNTYAQNMYAYGMCFSKDKELVKDSIHEVFVNVYHNKKKIQYKQFKFYLFRSLRNHLYNAFRDEKETLSIEEYSFFIPVYSVEESFIEDEQLQLQKEKITHMLSSLSFTQKEILYCRYMEGMSISEISELMQINYQSVLNSIQRSLSKLRKEFTE